MGAVIRNKVTRADLAMWNGVTPTVTRQDATGGTVTGLMIGNDVDVLQVYGSGTDRTSASIASAISNISASSNVTLVFAPGTWTIDADLTIASNFTCHVPAGCVFNVDSGKTLTFSGLVFIDYPSAWTTGSGTVTSTQTLPKIRTAAEIAASVTPTNYSYLPGELLRIGEGVAGYTRSWTMRRVYNVAEFPGAEFGAKLQACYDYALAEAQAGDGLGEGIAIMIPPNPDGGWWEQTTEVDFSGGGYVHMFGVGQPYIVAAANLDYFVRCGVTNKSDRMTFENFELRPGNFTATAGILIGGGTRYRLSNIGAQKSGSDTGSITNLIDIDASQDPTGSGVSYLTAENIHDTGGGAVTNAMIRADGLIGSRISQMRVSKVATYGVQLISGDQAVQGNIIEGINGEAGTGASTALVRFEGTTNNVAYNTVRALNGQNTTDYGVQGIGTASKYLGNTFDVRDDQGFSTAGIDFSGITSGSVILPLLQQEYDSGTFTPTWDADSASPSLGDGTISGSFVRERDHLHIHISLVWGSTTTGGTGPWFFQVPTALQWTVVTGGAVGSAALQDSGTGFVGGVAITSGSIAPKIYVYSGDSISAKVGPTVPMTWAVGDTLDIDITMRVS